MPASKTATAAAAAAYTLIILSTAILLFTTAAAAQSPAHSPLSPRNPTKPAAPPLAPSPVTMPEPPSSGGGGGEAPSPGLDCMPYLLNLTDCLGYVVAGSNDTKPDPKCCGELGYLVDTQPVCLCQLLGNPEKTGFPIDVSKALKLPAVCKVSTPPVTLCAAFGYPVAGLGPSGAPSPTPGTLTLPTVAPSSSETPSASVSDGPLASSPSPGAIAGESNGASHLCISNLNFFIGLAFIVVLPYFF